MLVVNNIAYFYKEFKRVSLNKYITSKIKIQINHFISQSLNTELINKGNLALLNNTEITSEMQVAVRFPKTKLRRDQLNRNNITNRNLRILLVP